MPDPRHDLAPIIELPASQPGPATSTGHGVTIPVPGLLLVCAMLVAGFVRYRRRSAPIRAARRLARSADPRRAADALAALLAARTIEPDAAWRNDLERLRFGRPGPDDAALLARLCQQAEAALKRRH
jgi:hypothetical protein